MVSAVVKALKISKAYPGYKNSLAVQKAVRDRAEVFGALEVVPD